MNYYKTHFIFTLFFLLLLPNASYSATFITNILTDERDALPGDGVCSVVGRIGGICSLRAAIQESNALGGEHTIILESGTYVLSRAGRNEAEALVGDLDITANITIEGEGADYTIIDGRLNDRVFDIKNALVTLRNLSITRGEVMIVDTNGDLRSGGLGGALLVVNSTVNIDNVWFYENAGMGMGGAIFAVVSNLDIQHSLFYKNASVTGGGMASVNSSVTVNESFFFYHRGNRSATLEPGSAGGGIYNFGDLTITKSIFLGNYVALDGGAIYHGLGTLSISNSTIANNSATRNGGGLYYRMGEVGRTTMSDTPVLRNVSITGNSAAGIDKTDPLQTFIPINFGVDLSSFENLGSTGNRFTVDFDISIPGELGESDGGIGGAGIMVAGQTGQGQREVSLSVVNSIISGNIGLFNVVDDCATTSLSKIISLGGNVTSDSQCSFANALDLPTSTYAELQLVPFGTNNILRNTFSIYAYGAINPHSLMNQSYYNQLAPHVQVYPSSSMLRGAAVDAYCPPDDQRGQARVNCDVGAYEFYPPAASPMQFVVKPGGSIVSIFAVPGPPASDVIYEIRTPVTQGVLSQPDGFSSPNWIYLANVGATGSDSFVYRACYPSIGECSNEATVNIKIVTDSDAAETITIDVVDVVDVRRDVTTGSYRYPAIVDRIDIVNEADLISGLEDTEYSFPFGAMFFSVENIAPPDASGLVRVSVRLQLPMDSEIPENVQIRKLDNSGNWSTLRRPSFGGAPRSTGEFDPINKTITLTLIDNDEFDLNPTVGIIRDPVALGVPINSANKSTGIQFVGAGGAVNIVYCLLLVIFIGAGRFLRRH